MIVFGLKRVADLHRVLLRSVRPYPLTIPALARRCRSFCQRHDVLMPKTALVPSPAHLPSIFITSISSSAVIIMHN